MQKTSHTRYPSVRTQFVRLLLVFIFASAINEASGQCTVNNPRIVNRTVNIGDRITGFLEYLPSDYSSTSTNYPLLIFWSGQDQIGSFCNLLTQAVPKVINDNNFPETVQDGTGTTFKYIVIAPILDNPYVNLPIDASEADAMLSYLLANYRINTQKIYMTGFSFGSYITMDNVSSTTLRASKMAAVASVSNCFANTFPDYSARVSNLATAGVDIWGIQCQSDPVCPNSWIQSWVTDVNAINPGQATYTELTVCSGLHSAYGYAYEPTFTNASGKNLYQWLIQFSSNFSLPAKIKDYSAKLEKSKVIIDWTTTAEANTDRFILERARPGQNFQQIASVAAAGNSSAALKYSIIDDQPLGGTSLYRLASVDKDARMEYFETKRINIPANWSARAIIPNPSEGNLSVYLNFQKAEQLTIQLIDLNGRVLKSIERSFTPGITETRMDVSNLSRGIYLVRLSGQDLALTKRVVVNR